MLTPRSSILRALGGGALLALTLVGIAAVRALRGASLGVDVRQGLATFAFGVAATLAYDVLYAALDRGGPARRRLAGAAAGALVGAGLVPFYAAHPPHPGEMSTLGFAIAVVIAAGWLGAVVGARRTAAGARRRVV